MTQVPENVPHESLSEGPELLIKNGVRTIFFSKECMDKVQIKRKINGDEWKVIGENVNIPFYDDEELPEDTIVNYMIEFNDKPENVFIIKALL